MKIQFSYRVQDSSSWQAAVGRWLNKHCWRWIGIPSLVSVLVLGILGNVVESIEFISVLDYPNVLIGYFLALILSCICLFFSAGWDMAQFYNSKVQSSKPSSDAGVSQS
jgi:hypothetical protein